MRALWCKSLFLPFFHIHVWNIEIWTYFSCPDPEIL